MDNIICDDKVLKEKIILISTNAYKTRYYIVFTTVGFVSTPGRKSSLKSLCRPSTCKDFVQKKTSYDDRIC